MQPEVLAVREPIFLTRLERFVRLANDLELIVTKKFFQRWLELGQFRWNRSRLRNVFRNHQPAPNGLGCISRNRAYRQREEHGEKQRPQLHRRFIWLRNRPAAFATLRSREPSLCYRSCSRRCRWSRLDLPPDLPANSKFA